METRVGLLSLVILIQTTFASNTIRLQAESFSTRHAIAHRSNASEGKTVSVQSTAERLTIPFCLYKQSTQANISVAYSNDGAEDIVKIQVGDNQNFTLKSVAKSDGGKYWNFFRTVTLGSVVLKRGYNLLTLTFEKLDQDGIEIDFVAFSVDDVFLTEDILRCRLVVAEEDPEFAGSVTSGVSPGYVTQRSYVTPCPEEDNVHLPVYHPSVTKYAVTASHPLYRTLTDYKTNDDSKCPNLGYIYWRFENILLRNGGDSWKPTAPKPNLYNATIVGRLVESPSSLGDVGQEVEYTVLFDLKGFKKGFIDADIHTLLRGVFHWNKNLDSGLQPPTIDISYTNRQGKTVSLPTYTFESDDTRKNWTIPEMTWSEDDRNSLKVKVSDSSLELAELELFRGYTGPDRPVDIYSSDKVILQGFRTDFWWRRPKGESLTVRIGNQTTTDLFYVALYVPVPWTGKGSVQQIFVLYQDGNVRVVPLPYSFPPSYKKNYAPFGTSVIVGQSSPDDVRPAASIREMTFNPDTFQMDLIYYDGSSCTLALTYTMWETRLEVKDIHFQMPSASLPFATFRSMFVEFGNTDSDSLQSERAGPVHVMGAWQQLNGTEFVVYRAVESHHLTHSPDIRLTILEQA